MGFYFKSKMMQVQSANLNLDVDGAQYFPAVIDQERIGVLIERLDPLIDGRPGRRLFSLDLAGLLDEARAVRRIAVALIGPLAKPVRILAFDKTPETNWSVGWHQDRTIAVRERKKAEGFGPWSTKDGVAHVTPPISILEAMVTLRVHLDDCGMDNAPLKIALGSHRLGLVPADQALETAQSLCVHACHANAGDIWAYATPILHASEPSRASGHRRVLQIDFAAFDLPGGLQWAVDG